MSEDNRDRPPDSSQDSKPNTEEKTVNEPQDFQAELEKSKNDYLYLRAEFDNFRKQVIKERSHLLKYGSERIILEILNIMDTFERALATPVSNDNISEFKKGMEMTATELRAVMERFGVNEVPCENVPFDPLVHEAIGNEPTDKVEPGTITQVFKKGYRLHDRVIRAGQVVVAGPMQKPEA